jgi:hypothetical protein
LNPGPKLETIFLMNEVPLEQLSAERFAELVGTEFSVDSPGGQKVPLVLRTVTQPRSSGASEPTSRYESFSLFFDGPSERPLAQQTYSFEHGQLGQFSLFIVPIGNQGGCLQYEVVFNRLRKGL